MRNVEAEVGFKMLNLQQKSVWSNDISKKRKERNIIFKKYLAIVKSTLLIEIIGRSQGPAPCVKVVCL